MEGRILSGLSRMFNLAEGMLQQAEFFCNKPPEPWRVEQLERFLFPWKKPHRMLPDSLHNRLSLLQRHWRLSYKRHGKVDEPSQVSDLLVLFLDF